MLLLRYVKGVLCIGNLHYFAANEEISCRKYCYINMCRASQDSVCTYTFKHLQFQIIEEVYLLEYYGVEDAVCFSRGNH